MQLANFVLLLYYSLFCSLLVTCLLHDIYACWESLRHEVDFFSRVPHVTECLLGSFLGIINLVNSFVGIFTRQLFVIF